jgi:multidrug resistance efflux pump
MPLKRTIPLLDRHVSLLSAREEAEAEMARLEREEEYLRRQVREAREQVRYYEGLLTVLRKDWGKPAPLAELVRKLG